MNNAQVAHKWAAQSAASGKGSNFYFNGTRIYSYGSHFVAARFTDAHDDQGDQIVLINANSYSMATAKHLSLVRSALRGLDVNTIAVEYPDHEGADNFRAMESTYGQAIKNASRARVHGDSYIAEAMCTQSDAVLYANAFQLTVPAWAYEPINADLLARTKEAAKRETAQRAEQTKKREALRIADYAEKSAAWRAGESQHTCELWRFQDMPTMLRLASDGKHIETSRSATITLRTGKSLFRAVNDCRSTGDEYRFRIASAFPNIDGFQLRKINADGAIVVGCHTLEWSEIERFATAQGWMK